MDRRHSLHFDLLLPGLLQLFSMPLILFFYFLLSEISAGGFWLSLFFLQNIYQKNWIHHSPYHRLFQERRISVDYPSRVEFQNAENNTSIRISSKPTKLWGSIWVKCDESIMGIGAVLTQDGHPLSIFQWEVFRGS